MQSINVEKSVKSILVQLEETDQHQGSGEQMRDVEADGAH